MALVSITEAARLVRLSRTQLYRGYIQKGKISTVTTDGKPPQIDTSELQRVFGNLSPVTETVAVAQLRTVTTKKNDTETALLRQEVTFLREQLQAEKEHSQELKQALRLLEHKPADQSPPGQDQHTQELLKRVQDLQQALELVAQQQTAQEQLLAPAKPRGFWQKLFRG